MPQAQSLTHTIMPQAQAKMWVSELKQANPAVKV
jgi:hypothetical protein